MGIKITTSVKKVTIAFMAPDRSYRQGVSSETISILKFTTQEYPTELILWTSHSIVRLLRLLLDARVSSQQPECIHQDRLSSSAMTPSIDWASETQHSSFTSAEGVVPTQEYSSKSIIWTTMLFGLPRTSFRLQRIVLPSSQWMTYFDEGPKNNQV
jgi:hypothetical protein